MKKLTHEVHIGNVTIGGGHPVAIQSMCNTDTKNIDSTVAQIHALEARGCEIIRIAIYDAACAAAIREIKRQISIPLVADIHFDHRLAVASIENGIDKIRINPGNIGTREQVKCVVDAAKAAGVPIRVGVNSGSLERELAPLYRTDPAEALAQSAMGSVHMLEDMGFSDIVISPKCPDADVTIAVYRKISECCDYPLHLGVTEAGTYEQSLTKSSVALGSLLCDGIGDTIRVSVTGDPCTEIDAAKLILSACRVRHFGPTVVSCPTCGRTRIDVAKLTGEVQRRVAGIHEPLRIAVMGCVVNGPGEAREADFGIAGGDGKCALFAKGEYLATVDECIAVDKLLELING